MGELVPFNRAGSRPPLQSGGGGGTFDRMEARVKALEDRSDRVDGKLDALIRDVAEIKGKLSNMPGYPGLFVVCGTLAGLVALIIRFLPPAA
jgi:hypothetical protein